MEGMVGTAHGAARRPRRRPPARVRWPRRIAGVLATAALLGVAVEMGLMIAPSRDAGERAVGPAPAATPAAKKKHHAKPAKPHKPKLTKAQLKARDDAVGALRTQGYVAVRPKDYDPRHELRVLVGYRSGDPLGPRRAFFFVKGRFVAYDTATPSASLKVAKSGKRSVTLAYGLFAPGDKACCPSAGRQQVKFVYRGGAVTPLGTLPPIAQRTATG
jgi:hypothetical protein